MLVLVLFIVLTATNVIAQCPSGYTYSNNFSKCYKVFSSTMHYSYAQLFCYNVGANLVTISSAFENSYVLSLLPDSFTTYSIGLNSIVNRGEWSWLDKSAVSYLNWAPGQPSINELCTAMNSETGIWSAVDCDTPHQFVCSLNTANNSITSCTPKAVCDSGWTYFNQTNSCYKVLHGATFSNAEDICLASEAHLTSIHSKDEDYFVDSLAKSGKPMDYNGDTWLGLHKVNNAWVYTDGSTADYFNWAPGEPNNAGNNEYCVEMITDYDSDTRCSDKNRCGETYWNDYPCESVMRAFVCKKPTN